MVWLIIILVVGFIAANILVLKYSAKTGWLTKAELDKRGIKAKPKKDEDDDDEENN